MAITTNYKARSDAVPLRSFKTKGRPSAIAGVGVYAPERVLSNFDIFATAGAQNKAVTEQFTTTSNSSGQVVISFTQGAHDNPEVAGIEILH